MSQDFMIMNIIPSSNGEKFLNIYIHSIHLALISTEKADAVYDIRTLGWVKRKPNAFYQ